MPRLRSARPQAARKGLSANLRPQRPLSTTPNQEPPRIHATSKLKPPTTSIRPTTRSHEYRLRNAKIGAFKDRSEFDWKHPSKVDRFQIDELFTLDFINEGTNVVFVGPNGIGKTMLARNLAYEAVLRGVSTRYTSASDMLATLGGLTGSMLTQRLQRYTKATLLVVDELGYLRYDNHLADLLYEVISRRYDAEASTIITTNKPFSEGNQVFEGAACVSTMIDRLCHRVEFVKLEGNSYRAKAAASLAKKKRPARSKRPPRKTSPKPSK